MIKTTRNFLRLSVQNLKYSSTLKNVLKPTELKKTYDVAIIGGGSAGLGFAIAAKKLGLSMVLFDYVTPSPRGTTWGLGGTCVNVGCIPKKLMHMSSLQGEIIHQSRAFGWELSINEDPNDPQKLYNQFNWKTLKDNVQNHIKGLNFVYKMQMISENTPYLNALAGFKDTNTLFYSNNQQLLRESLEKEKLINDEVKSLKFKYAVIGTGGRPSMLECLKDVAITSDDIFSLNKPPGKTLVVGGGYIAVETAGFLAGLGYPVTSMTRSIYLRDFDQDISKRIVENLQKHNNVRIIPTSLPTKAEKQQNGKILVTWSNTQDLKAPSTQEEFDTVLVAIGRNANTSSLNLEKIGVKINKKNNKIIGGVDGEVEKTHVKNIYALGDCLDGVPELFRILNHNFQRLQPIAQKSGALLPERIKQLLDNKPTNTDEYKSTILDYKDFPTTIFTPWEYSVVGLNEEQAIKKLGLVIKKFSFILLKENIEIYHSLAVPLEEKLLQRFDENYSQKHQKVYCKVICDKRDDNRVVGIHYLGPNAGEVMQGYAVAIKLGVKFRDLQRTIAIHPTNAEEFTLLKITKASGQGYEKQGCCA